MESEVSIRRMCLRYPVKYSSSAAECSEILEVNAYIHSTPVSDKQFRNIMATFYRSFFNTFPSFMLPKRLNLRFISYYVSSRWWYTYFDMLFFLLFIFKTTKEEITATIFVSLIFFLCVRLVVIRQYLVLFGTQKYEIIEMRI